MPAKSKAQQKFMGMVHAAQEGVKAASPEVAAAAKSMSKKSAKDFASTSQAGLPEHKKQRRMRKVHVDAPVKKMSFKG
jgi:hypothetical protein